MNHAYLGHHTSNVTNMNCMFADTSFDFDLSKWETSKVTDMKDTFFGCATKTLDSSKVLKRSKRTPSNFR